MLSHGTLSVFRRHCHTNSTRGDYLKSFTVTGVTLFTMKSIVDLKARRAMDRANEGEYSKAPGDNTPDYEHLSKEDDLD